ncbi:hypothetical protein [Tannerella forsythia]|uniref:restriction endonuclease n=1 Tax=Tannerella forsythia TaxID=28112 RepID=UPI0028E5D8CB|nr:hypothetical protein [Tannerella forsythia]
MLTKTSNSIHETNDMYTKTQNRIHVRSNMYMKTQNSIHMNFSAEMETETGKTFPIGHYNPDRALIFEDDKKICFVAETKDTDTT